ncbi:hypothetical protein [Blastococcus sp. Marseille-P5729]|uniref:hypothetical protein n=1 Tax=Blastococcus sp. Marseille-P5729 TaxID=2086582 RepID=UPI001F21C363|nr:hypothetical protein [Blastococcus sp. Marseille-P5729]
MSMTVLAADLVEPIASTGRLVVAALVAIAVIVALILWAKLNAFISLTIGALLVSTSPEPIWAPRSRASRPASGTRSRASGC